MDTGDTAWVLASAALVLLMTPGLALFYGGMVRAKSVLNMMMMSFGALALISVLWVLYGYSMAFGNDVGGGLLGSPSEFFGLEGLMGPRARQGLRGHEPGLHDPVDGVRGLPGRVRHHHRRADLRRDRRPRPVRSLDGVRRLWATVVYFPVAHWVFAFDGAESETGGWIANKLLAIDFAGGTAVHINAGAAGLALAHRARQAPRLAAGTRCGRTTCRW